MTTQNIYEDIEHIVHISTNMESSCQICGERQTDPEYFEKLVNHYLEKHGYKLLHIGSEWERDAEGKSCHHTVAVVGK